MALLLVRPVLLAGVTVAMVAQVRHAVRDEMGQVAVEVPGVQVGPAASHPLPVLPDPFPRGCLPGAAAGVPARAPRFKNGARRHRAGFVPLSATLFPCSDFRPGNQTLEAVPGLTQNGPPRRGRPAFWDRAASQLLRSSSQAVSGLPAVAPLAGSTGWATSP